MGHVDFKTEPLPGLPALPPDGEQILWQGSPRWQTVARRILHIDVLAIYFVLLLAWRIERGVHGGLRQNRSRRPLPGALGSRRSPSAY